ncbi:NAD-dependent epimerase/dehydratase family protein [Candidatus Woesearchaeota archaeon]|nr:NAD-dependent epimerase/dehydratase family protein [Candidatus Woesearchaeota archaeon]
MRYLGRFWEDQEILNAYTNKKILVTGGGGFIGRNLIDYLSNLPVEIHILQPFESNIPNVNAIKADIRNMDQISKAVTDISPDIIFHLAGQIPQSPGATPESLHEINYKGTINLLESLKSLKYASFVNVCTGQVYGKHNVPFEENFTTNPISEYAKSKLLATEYCQKLADENGLPHITLRLSNVYGPYQSANMFIPSLINSCLQNKVFRMTPGKQKKDSIYVKDIVHAFLKAAICKPAHGHVINIAQGESYRIIDIAKKIMSLTGTKIKLNRTLPYNDKDVFDYSFNIYKAKKVLAWMPKYSLDQGLKETIDSMRDKIK